MGGSLLHVHAAQQRRRSGAGASELPAAFLAHPLSVLHQPLTRGHRLADFGHRHCYSPDWIWEETQLFGVRCRGGGGLQGGEGELRDGQCE